MYGTWKYIVFPENQDNEKDSSPESKKVIKEHAIIFPKAMVHAEVATTLDMMEKTFYCTDEPVGAGFVFIGPDGVSCNGESTSLNIPSRHEIDSELIIKTIQWKYLVLQAKSRNGTFEYPVLFPTFFDHEEAYDYLSGMDEFRELRIDVSLVSGGYVIMNEDGIFCSGGIPESTINSRVGQDEELIMFMGYEQHGFGTFRSA